MAQSEGLTTPTTMVVATLCPTSSRRRRVMFLAAPPRSMRAAAGARGCVGGRPLLRNCRARRTTRRRFRVTICSRMLSSPWCRRSNRSYSSSLVGIAWRPISWRYVLIPEKLCSMLFPVPCEQTLTKQLEHQLAAGGEKHLTTNRNCNKDSLQYISPGPSYRFGHPCRCTKMQHIL